MSKFAFVILHYNTIDDTHNCVESIRKYVQGTEYHIIIVDNCSPNQSGQILENEYESANDITVILNPKNLGFARGNNVGFLYAKEKLKVDFIVLSNNDTTLLDNSFAELVEEEYNRSQFAVLGPLIKTPNPPYYTGSGRSSIVTKRECFFFILLLSFYYLLSLFGIDMIVRMLLSKNSNPKIETHYFKRIENRQLHGCFLVFSPQYIRRFDGLNSNTFLYREEELLFIRIMQNGLKSVFLPELIIFHKGESSTVAQFSGNRNKRRFGYKQRIKSTIILLKELYR